MTDAPATTNDLVSRPVDALGAVVRRFPRAVVAAVVALTVALLVLPGLISSDVDQAAVELDVPEIIAAQTLAETFGDGGDEAMFVLVRIDEGTLVGADGYAAADAIETAIRSSGASDRIAEVEGRPGVISWMFPAQLAMDGATTSSDADVTAAYAAGLAALPDEQARFASGLLPSDAGPDDADSALLLVVISAEGLADDPVDAFHEVAGIAQTLSDATGAATLPTGVTAAPFSAHLMVDDDVMGAEIGMLFAGAFGIIMLILLFVYWVRPTLGSSRARSARRCAADMLLSMAAIVMAICWMMGIATLLGPAGLGLVGPDNSFTQVIPILLIGLGVDYALHLTSRYREEVGSGASVTDGIRGAIGTAGGALALATIATAIGFLTNLANPLPDLRAFGVMAAVGILAAFVVTLTFVPAARLLLDRRAERTGRLPAPALGHNSERLLPALMARTSVLAEKVPVLTLSVTLVLAGLGVFGMTQLETRFSQLDFIPRGSPVLETVEELNARFNDGLGEFTEVLVTGPVATAAAHNALIEVHAALADVDDVVVHDGVANAQSPATLLGQLLAPGPDGQPADPAAVAAADAAGVGDDLGVAEGADVHALYSTLAAMAPEAAGQLLAGQGGAFDRARIVVQTTANEQRAGQLADTLAGVLTPLEAAGLTAVATSDGIATHAFVKAIEASQTSSLAITLLAAMLLLVGVFAYERRRPALGVITTIPVLLVVLWTFGTMALTGIPFGPITATIAALAIGIGLPYAIHVVHRFNEDRARHHDVADAIRSTVRHTGGAMAGSAFTTMAGFGILTTSSFMPFRQLGAVMVYAVGFSLVAATLVLPSILVVWDRWHHRGAAAVPAAPDTMPSEPAAVGSRPSRT